VSEKTNSTVVYIHRLILGLL